MPCIYTSDVIVRDTFAPRCRAHTVLQVKRKRKRFHQPADPSLSHCPSPSASSRKTREHETREDVSEDSQPVAGSSRSSVHVDRAHSPPPEPEKKVPRIQTRASAAKVAETATPTITVERFLQMSAAEPKKAKKPRFVDLTGPASEADSDSSFEVIAKRSKRKRVAEEDVDCQLSDSDSSDDSSQPRARPVRSCRKNPRERFSMRMLRAAALTGVDVGDDNDVVPTTGGRKPLKLDTVKTISDLGGKSREDRSSRVVKTPWRLVDPKKVPIPKVSDFPFLQQQVDEIKKKEKKIRPISAWRPVFPAQSSSVTAPPRVEHTAPARRAPRAAPSSSTRNQLTFIPWAEREKAVAARRRSQP